MKYYILVLWAIKTDITMKLKNIFLIFLIANLTSCGLNNSTDNLTAEQLFIKASDKFETDNYEIALDYFIKAKQKKDSLPKIDLMIGMSYFIINTQDSALKYLDMALQRDSLSIEPYYMRGQIYFDNQEYEIAIQDFKKIINEEKDAHMIFLIGKSYLAMVEPDSALKYFDNAIGLNDTDYYWFQSRAIAYTMLEDFQSAIHDCDSALDLNKKDGPVYLTRANAYLNIGDTISACEDFNLAKNLTTVEDDHKLSLICN